MNQQRPSVSLDTLLDISALSQHEQLQPYVLDLLEESSAKEVLYQTDSFFHCLCSQSTLKSDAIYTLLSAIVVTESGSSAHAFRQVILKFIIYQLENTTHILPALQFISHQAPYLFPTPLETLKQRIFALCFMLQTTGGYWDLQIRFWMYKALEDLQMPSSRWLQQIQSSPAIQDAETLKQSRTIVEACQRSPSHHVYWAQQWMEILPPAIVSGSVSIQLNLFIYHTLCPYEITGLLHTLHSSRSVSMSAVKLSDDSTRLLKEMNKIAPLFELESDSLTEQLLSNTKWIAIDPTLQSVTDTLNTFFLSTEKIEDYMREWHLAIQASHSRFLAHITGCVIALVKFSSGSTKESLLVRQCYSSWISLLTNVLEQMAFDMPNTPDNYNVNTLVKVASYCILCLYSFDKHSTQEATDELVRSMSRLSQHYHTTRRIFLKAFPGQHTEQDRVEHILSTITHFAKENLQSIRTDERHTALIHQYTIV